MKQWQQQKPQSGQQQSTPTKNGPYQTGTKANFPHTPDIVYYEKETLRSIVTRVGRKTAFRLISFGATVGILVTILIVLVIVLLTSHQIR